MQVNQQASDQSNQTMVVKRLDRIREYLMNSLNDADPLQANLGAASSDLMAMALRLKCKIDNALEEPSALSKQFDEIAPMIEMYLKLSRQAERFTEQSRRWRVDRNTVSAASPR